MLGSGNTITLKDSILIHENASLSLGKNNSRKASALTLTSNDDTRSILDLQGSATLSMYDGVTLSSSKSTGRPGAIDLNDNSQFLMHGGKIINCDSMSVAGGVYVKDTSQFLMYDGVINNCSGWEGGAVGIADGSTAIGGSSGSDGKFHMYGGKIKNCSDCYEGGGAVCILSWRAENHGCFVMDGGTITDCYTEDSSEYGGGAIYINAKDANANINGGSITKNHTAKTGGGIYIRSGAASVSPEVKLYNNSGEICGDDIALGGTFSTAKLSKGTVPANLSLSPCGHTIDGWYNDNSVSRWNPEVNYPIKDTSSTVTTSSRVKAFKVAHGIICKIDATPSPLDFGSADEGYTSPNAQTVTVTNRGNREMTLTQPVSESGNFTIGELSSLTLGVGESATFTVQPKANFISGNYTDDISISGSSMGQSAESIVKVSFSVNEIYYDLTVDLDGGDGATLSGSFPGGEVIDIDAGSKNNYTFSGWTTSNGGTFADSSAAITTFTMPHADTTITASWIRTLYTIDASAGNGGTISPSGKNTVQAGDNSEYTITPSDGYVISDVKIDGNSIGAVSTYTFDYVQQSHTIEATFKKALTAHPVAALIKTTLPVKTIIPM